jgi:hypothetical protein
LLHILASEHRVAESAVHDRAGPSSSVGAGGRRPDIIGNGNDVSA